jgi:hypothetical protein
MGYYRLLEICPDLSIRVMVRIRVMVGTRVVVRIRLMGRIRIKVKISDDNLLAPWGFCIVSKTSKRGCLR